MSDNAKEICLPGNRGLFLPFTDHEQYMDKVLRGFMIAFQMIYCFLGVSILADVFVGSIVVITGRRKKAKCKTSGRVRTVKVWNDTVANLSLLALGSSAPEIALVTVEVLKNRFFVGKLGVATIIGSGAFNLLVIVAVCVVVIPSAEVRLIQNYPAFLITAIFSVLAYMWLGFILVTNTTDTVDIWESIVTFAFLPLLIYVSYKVDIGDLNRFFPQRLLSFLTDDTPTEEAPTGIEPSASFAFAAETMQLQGSSERQILEVNVILREAPCTGVVSCSYHTEELCAVQSYDFEAAEGRLEFAEGVTEQSIKLEIPARGAHRIARDFLVILDDVDGMVKFDPNDDGGSESAICTVKIDPVAPSLTGKRKLMRLVDAACNIDQLRLGTHDWIEQFPAAVYCNGSRDEQRSASLSDWCWHILCLPWNLLFAFVPPPRYYNGWVCFFSSLIFLFLVAATLTDLAELFGCVVEVPDIVTAVTFVAVGTSVPDLFASLAAARMEPTADASVVNVTGSNSVNVFLGIGLPWSMASIYWRVNGSTPEWEARYPEVAARLGPGEAVLVVESLHLGWGILIFTSATVACISILLLRRKLLGAELGGPFYPKLSAFIGFLVFWFGFIVVTSYRSIRHGKASRLEWYLVLVSIGVLETLTVLWCWWVTVRHWRRAKAQDTRSNGHNKGKDEDDEWAASTTLSVLPGVEPSQCTAQCTAPPTHLPGELLQ